MHSTIRDYNAVLQIDPISRQVIVPADCRVVGVAGDHSSEQLTIQCPRYIEGHDVAGCAMKWIGWQNAKGEAGEYEITDVEIDAEGFILFTWTAAAGLTAYAGEVAFAVHFMDVDSNGQVVYKWSTATSRDLRVLESLGNRIEEGVGQTYAETGAEGSGLINLEVDEGKINAAVYAAVRRVLYG